MGKVSGGHLLKAEVTLNSKQVAQGFVQMGLGNLQGSGSLSGTPVPVLNYLHSNFIFTYTHYGPLFEVMPVISFFCTSVESLGLLGDPFVRY